MYNKYRQREFIFITALMSLISILSLYFQIFHSASLKVEALGTLLTVAPLAQSVNSNSNITLSFVSSTNLNAGSIIKVVYYSTYAGTLSTANVTVNGVSPTLVSSSPNLAEIVSNLTIAAAINSGSVITINFSGLTSPITAGNYIFKVRTTTNDFAANFQYVGQANVVQVRALVPMSLSFSIRNAADTANTNVCDLGTASTFAISKCQYRLKIGTNANNGYTVSMQASGNLTDGYNNITSAAAGVSGAGGTNIIAGTEAYGVNITPGSITGALGNNLLSGAFNAGTTKSVEYSATTPTVVMTANKPNNPGASGDLINTSLITHNIAISSSTTAGNYTQSIVYTVSPAF